MERRATFLPLSSSSRGCCCSLSGSPCAEDAALLRCAACASLLLPPPPPAADLLLCGQQKCFAPQLPAVTICPFNTCSADACSPIPPRLHPSLPLLFPLWSPPSLSISSQRRQAPPAGDQRTCGWDSAWEMHLKLTLLTFIVLTGYLKLFPFCGKSHKQEFSTSIALKDD